MVDGAAEGADCGLFLLEQGLFLLFRCPLTWAAPGTSGCSVAGSALNSIGPAGRTGN